MTSEAAHNASRGPPISELGVWRGFGRCGMGVEAVRSVFLMRARDLGPHSPEIVPRTRSRGVSSARSGGLVWTWALCSPIVALACAWLGSSPAAAASSVVSSTPFALHSLLEVRAPGLTATHARQALPLRAFQPGAPLQREVVAYPAFNDPVWQRSLHRYVILTNKQGRAAKGWMVGVEAQQVHLEVASGQVFPIAKEEIVGLELTTQVRAPSQPPVGAGPQATPGYPQPGANPGQGQPGYPPPGGGYPPATGGPQPGQQPQAGYPQAGPQPGYPQAGANPGGHPPGAGAATPGYPAQPQQGPQAGTAPTLAPGQCVSEQQCAVGLICHAGTCVHPSRVGANSSATATATAGPGAIPAAVPGYNAVLQDRIGPGALTGTILAGLALPLGIMSETFSIREHRACLGLGAYGRGYDPEEWVVEPTICEWDDNSGIKAAAIHATAFPLLAMSYPIAQTSATHIRKIGGLKPKWALIIPGWVLYAAGTINGGILVYSNVARTAISLGEERPQYRSGLHMLSYLANIGATTLALVDALLQRKAFERQLQREDRKAKKAPTAARPSFSFGVSPMQDRSGGRGGRIQVAGRF